MKHAVIKVPQAFLYATEEDACEKKHNHKSGIVDEVLYGWNMKILAEKKNCFFVRTFYGYEGYLEKTATEKSGKKQMTEWVVTASWADILRIPKVQGEIMLTLPRGSRIAAADHTEDGYRMVRLQNGKRGYLPEKSVDRIGYDVTEQELREKIVKTAESYLGTPYRWGGKTPAGIDCSGLSFMSYYMNGILIYRDAEIREGYPVHRIEKEKLQIGDLLFFPGHIGIYIGEGRFIHATGHRDSFGCVYAGFQEKDPGYRPDLKASLLACGSIF